MTLPRNIRKLIEAGQFDSVEDDWLTHLEENPDDLDYFAGVARPLAAAGEPERSRLLLELLDEHHRGNDKWEGRLEVLRRVGDLEFGIEELHGEILDTLRHLHPESPSFEGLAEKVGLYRAKSDLPKTWEKVKRLRSLLHYEVNSVLWMDGKGAGRVVEVNLELDNFKVDFEHYPGLRVGFRAAPKLLKPLPEGHILRRKLEQPDDLRALKNKDPGKLLGLILESYERPRTAAEIRTDLTGIVSEEEWSSWWSAARKDPRTLTVGKGARQGYTWASSGESALSEIRESFARASPAEKLEIYRRNAQRARELHDEMAAELMKLASEALTDEPAMALTVWHTLENRSVDLSGLSWTPESLIASSTGLRFVKAEVADRSIRAWIYGLVRESRPDWDSVYSDLITQEGDARLLDALAKPLAESSPQRLRSFLDRVLSQPRKHPTAFVWLAERADKDWLAQDQNSLRWLHQILETPRHQEFAALRSRITRLLDSGGPIVHLISRLSEDQAVQAERAIDRAPFEEYLRTPLLNALHLRFPGLRAPTETPLYALPESIEARREEVKKLLDEDIPANRRAIEEARALGDLSENFEYKSARQRHEYLSARVAALKNDLARAQPLSLGSQECLEVRAGCRLEFEGQSNKKQRTLTILGPWESQPEEDIISYESDLGQDLLGRKVGDTVQLFGEDYRLSKIAPFRS